MTRIFISLFAFGVVVGIAITMITIVSIMEHYERMEANDD